MSYNNYILFSLEIISLEIAFGNSYLVMNSVHLHIQLFVFLSKAKLNPQDFLMHVGLL